jgi:CBS domain-containing protein
VNNGNLKLMGGIIMLVKEIMSRTVEVIDAASPIQSAAEVMKNSDVGMLPVREGDQLIGILSDRDITVRATASGLDPTKTEVKDVVTPGVTYCFENQSIEEAAKLMQANRLRRLVVLNQQKKLAGILSIGDLAAKTDVTQLIGWTVKGVSL